MTTTADRLYELLPAIHRIRDAEQGYPLRELLAVIGEQVAAMQENLDQLYDDQFIETCADWVAPYIGDLIGYQTLHNVAPRIGSPRAEVANTIAYRRRKGTASMLEQLARDVTGWEARVVELFQLLATTQYMNHVRPANRAFADMRNHEALAAIGSAFDSAAHTLEVRSIARRRGRYNIPNIGIFLWRIRSYSLLGSPACKLVPGNAGDRRYLFSPLGNNCALYSKVEAEAGISHIAGRPNVPLPITRRELLDHKENHVGHGRSVWLSFAGLNIPASAIEACDLSDAGAGWAHQAVSKILIDPELGRIALPPALSVDGRDVDMADPTVSFYYGFSADMGGGDYARASTFSQGAVPLDVAAPAALSAALSSLAGQGIVQVTDNGHYREVSPALKIQASGKIELRAQDGVRPTILLDGDLVIDGSAEGAEVTLNGLLIAGGKIIVPAGARLARLRICHCTCVPGLALNVDGSPARPGEASLVVEAAGVAVEIDHSIVGAIRAHPDASVTLTDSIVDANDATQVAYAAPDGKQAGGVVEMANSTVIGKVHARMLKRVSNSILFARLLDADSWKYAVWAERRQEGCVRFSYVPPDSQTPRRYRCQPASAATALAVQPQFTSLQCGHAAYCQLGLRTADELRSQADDGAEMGAFHDLYGPQRETNLRVRLEEYLRFGLEAGIFYAS